MVDGGAEKRAGRYRVLREAVFDDRLATYYLLSSVMVLALTIVLIPVAVVYYVVGRYFIARYIERLSCTLTERTLEIRRGWLNRVESTIPLEKITDLQMVQGSIMRLFDLRGFKVETAGQSAGPGSHLVSLIGIVDASAFREAVLEQRDALADREGHRSAPAHAAPAPTGQQDQPDPQRAEAIALLTEIRDAVLRLESQARSGRADP